MNLAGFSFLELLITLIIVSVGLLTIAGLDIAALRNTQQTYLFSVANTQLFSMLERLRVTRTPREIASECQRWNDINKALLPNSDGICHCLNNECTVSLKWQSHAEAKQLSMQAAI